MTRNQAHARHISRIDRVLRLRFRSHQQAARQGERAMHRPNRNRFATYVALLLLLATAGTARAEIVDLRWSADGHFTHQGTVAAAKFVEVCGKLPAQIKVQWNFVASAPLDFNVHYHVSKEVVVYPSKLSAVSNAKDTLTTKIEQDYCWMWSNKTAAPAELRVTLQR